MRDAETKEQNLHANLFSCAGPWRWRERLAWGGFALACLLLFSGCSGKPAELSDEASAAGASSARRQVEAAPPAEDTGGFDGARAYQHVASMVAFGPHPAGSEGDRKVQDYLIAQLKGFGCTVDVDDFHASTPVGNVAMKNILVKVSGASPDILLFASHYDSAPSNGERDWQPLPNFVGADDGGSSTGILLEFARHVCARTNALTIWLAFLDGEEAFHSWSASDSTYGSRELAARMALSGELAHLQAMLLVDMVGESQLHIRRESFSTKWLADVVWSAAGKTGHQDAFVSAAQGGIEDDHLPFLNRKIPALDMIEYDDTPSSERWPTNTSFPPYWHTNDDTLDKVSPRSLAIVGHVLIASLPLLEQKLHPGGRP